MVQKKEFVQVNLKNKINATDDIDNAEFEAAKLKLYNPKGNIEKEYSYKENYLNILDRTNGDNLSVQNDINQPFSIKLNEVSSNGYYTRVNDKGIKISKELQESFLQELKGAEKEQQQKRVVEKLKKELAFAQQNNIGTYNKDLYPKINACLSNVQS